MKKIYWRPHRVSRMELFVIAVLALAGVFLVEKALVREKQPRYKEKIAAAKLTRDAFDAIREERIKRGPEIDTEFDPQGSGLIGVLMSSVTTNTGHLSAKQTTVNPNFAAVIVDWLNRADVKENDVVAAGMSGSFPALNICAFAAMKAMGARPVVISSASGSQWGANTPDLLWPDMEKILFDRGLFDFRSVAASRGGVEDKALGLTKKGKKLLDETVEKNGLIPIQEETYADSLNRRFALYEEYSGDSPIKAYINIGGGTISVGTSIGKKMFKPGLNRKIPNGPMTVDSVIGRFALRGVPVIHLVRIDEIASRFGLPLQPVTPPPIGEGKMYFKEEYNPYLSYIVLAVILLAMIAFIRMDWGFRLLKTGRPSSKRQHPEPMV